MTRTMKRFMSVLCSVVMCILLLQAPVLQAQAATSKEDRVQVGTVVATSDMNSVFGFGNTVNNLKFTCTEGEVVRFYSYGWYRYDETMNKWSRASGTFIPGKYRYEVQVRVQDYYLETHVMKKTMDSFKVDGIEWIYEETYIDSVGFYSWANYNSPEFIIEEQETPIEFSYSSSNLPQNYYVNQAISSFSVASGVYGGVKPYTYSITSGPAWLSISSEGVVSGTPTTLGKNEKLVIRVTDANDDYKEVTLNIGETVLDPKDRQVVNLVTLSSNIDSIPIYGNSVVNPKLYVVGVSPVRVSFSYGWQYKKDDGTWADYQGKAFAAGTYRFDVQVRLDKPEAYEYQFVKPVQIIVDEIEWVCDYINMGDDYGWCNVQSPEFVVVEPEEAELVFAAKKEYDITTVNTYHPIEEFNVEEAVSGGKAPYTFSKISGPDWITVSADGTISGTPEASKNRGTLVVRVTDAKGDYKEISIDVSKTVTLPEDREVISSLEMISNINGLVEVDDTSKPVFDDDYAFSHEVTWLGWEKESKGAWEAYSGDEFAPGKYRCHVRVSIIGESCADYMLNKDASSVTIKVNDKNWKVESVSVTDSISSAEVYSSEIIIKPDLLEPGWKQIDGKWMYYEDGKPLTGWFKEDGKWYYFDEQGVMTKGWKQISGKWYYFASGVMATGWKQISGKWYYFDDGAMANGWKQIKDKWYYFDDGAMVSGWKQISGKWYYFDDGAMVSGWKQISSKWYYFDTASGAMVSGWKQISGKWYYFDGGVMVSGWKQISGKWYYFDGGVMVSGWKQISGKWYYFKDGAMVTGKQTIDGKTYTFDSNGVWVK